MSMTVSGHCNTLWQLCYAASWSWYLAPNVPSVQISITCIGSYTTLKQGWQSRCLLTPRMGLRVKKHSIKIGEDDCVWRVILVHYSSWCRFANSAVTGQSLRSGYRAAYFKGKDQAFHFPSLKRGFWNGMGIATVSHDGKRCFCCKCGCSYAVKEWAEKVTV